MERGEDEISEEVYAVGYEGMTCDSVNDLDLLLKSGDLSDRQHMLLETLQADHIKSWQMYVDMGSGWLKV